MTEEKTPETKPDQPIPAELIRPLYTDHLEINLDRLTMEKEIQKLDDRSQALQKRFDDLHTQFGVDKGAFTINLKTGKMTPNEKVAPPAPPTEPKP